MENLQKDLITILSSEENLIIDNKLNKNKIIEAALKLEPFLIKLLINNEIFKKHFFQEIENILVFDKIKFQRFVNNKSFLPDSYTAFKNKIGLTINDDSIDNFIKTRKDVVLAWPHKDCVLEGGQTKEDQKRNEIFWSETLAPNYIDRLLDTKVFTNFKKYDREGEHRVTELNETDNFIFKGNNLLVISSLLKTHRDKIKLIYIDPPYNTGGDANIFTYNNTFNHSTWLTFMKNRLNIAKKLLKKDGFIAIAIDHYELAYLTVLADEIFHSENRLGIISVVHKPEGRQFANFFSPSNEFMIVYAKDKKSAKFENVVIDEEKGSLFQLQDEKGNYKEKNYIRLTDGKYSLRINKPDGYYPIYVSKDFKKFSLEKDDKYYEVFPITNQGVERVWKASGKTFLEKVSQGEIIARKEKNNVVIYEKLRVSQVFTTHWVNKKYHSYHFGTKLLEKTLGRKAFSFPKSIHTVLDTLKILTGPNDIILDFFAGSGTTAHATIELNKQDNGNRKFILAEQLDNHIDICVERNQKIINNDSFVYAELMQFNQYYIDKIQNAINKEELLTIWKEMKEKAFISYQFDKDTFDKQKNAFKTASIETMQRYLIEVLDKNQLYVNLSEIEDSSFKISEEDKELNYSFYKK